MVSEVVAVAEAGTGSKAAEIRSERGLLAAAIAVEVGLDDCQRFGSDEEGGHANLSDCEPQQAEVGTAAVAGGTGNEEGKAAAVQEAG